MPTTVHKIQEIEIPKKESFLLDTNVLFWYTYEGGIYPAGKEPHHWQATQYPNFIKALLEGENKLYYSLYSIGELYHVTERLYVDLHNERCESEEDDDYVHHAKEMRREHEDDKKRLDVQFQGMCTDVSSIASPIPTFHSVNLENLSDIISSFKLDAVDALIFHSMDKVGLKNIVTDDSDFGFVDEINLYTANNYIAE